MTTQEIAEKMIPGTPKISTVPGEDWFPSGKCDGVIFRGAVHPIEFRNGLALEHKVKINGVMVTSKSQSEVLEKKALRYLAPSTKEERTHCRIVHSIGICNHLNGLTDLLATHFPFLDAERKRGNILKHWASMTEIGKKLSHPEVFPYLKVVPLEEGIWGIIYDPEDEIA